MTAWLTLSHFQNNISPMTLVPQFENRLNRLFFFEQIKQRWKQHNTIQSHLLVRIFFYLLYSTSKHGDFPGGPVVKNPPSNAAHVSLIPSGEIKILNTAGHKATHHNYREGCAPQGKILHVATKTQCSQINKILKKKRERENLTTKFFELVVHTVCMCLLSSHLFHNLLQFGPLISFSATFKNGTCPQVSSSSLKVSTLTY